jgi:hypothetical protein
MRAAIALLAASAALFALPGVSAAADPAPPVAAGPAIEFGTGAWTYFTDPRSVSDGNKTFTGWISDGGWVHVASYDWSSGIKRERILPPRTGSDDHNNPALTIRPDGRVMIFYSPHSGPRIPIGRKSYMYYAVSKLPGDISSWHEVHRVSVNTRGGLGYTYPSPIMLANGDVWLAWRGGNWMPTRSVLSSRGWKSARNLIAAPGDKRKLFKGHLPRRPYTKYAPAKNGRIHMVYTDGHPFEDRTSIYYASVSPTSDRLYRADGSPIGRAPVHMSQGQKIYSPRLHGNGWVMDVADDGTGNPVIAYTAGWNRFKKVQFRMTRWTGKRWDDRFITYASEKPRARANKYFHSFYSGGMTIDHNDPHRFFLSRGVRKNYRVEVWDADLQYETWKSQAVSAPGQGCFRPVGSVGPGPSMVFFLCGMHRTWTRYKSKVYGVPLNPRIP